MLDLEPIKRRLEELAAVKVLREPTHTAAWQNANAAVKNNSPTDLEALVAEVELLRSIVTALAEDDPKRFQQVESWDVCPHCDVNLTKYTPDRKERLPNLDEHLDSCAWRMSTEYLVE